MFYCVLDISRTIWCEGCEAGRVDHSTMTRLKGFKPPDSCLRGTSLVSEEKEKVERGYWNRYWCVGS